MKPRDRQLLKAAAFILWPVLGAAGLMLLTAAMVVAWPLIPLARLVEDEKGFALELFKRRVK
jgi:hypothetical protein